MSWRSPELRLQGGWDWRGESEKGGEGIETSLAWWRCFSRRTGQQGQVNGGTAGSQLTRENSLAEFRESWYCMTLQNFGVMLELP